MMDEELHDRRHPHRWDDEVYRQHTVPLFITICTRQRRPYFVPEVADIAVAVLLERAGDFGIRVDAYCIMPDHVHFVCWVESTESHFLQFIRRFKGDVSRLAHEAGNTEFAWERSYWDYSMRKEEHLPTRIRYTMENPVRKGYCAEWSDWPWSWVAEEYR